MQKKTIHFVILFNVPEYTLTGRIVCVEIQYLCPSLDTGRGENIYLAYSGEVYNNGLINTAGWGKTKQVAANFR